MIERHRIKADIEKKMLTGMIISREFLRDMQPMWNPVLLDIPFVRTVGKWCVEYWEGYKNAPGEGVQDIFDSKVRRKQIPEDEQDLVEAFLRELSDLFANEATPYNAPYWLDETEGYLEQQGLKQLAEDIEAYRVNGDIQEARELVQDFEPAARPKTLGLDPFSDNDLLERAFKEATAPLFTYPGALGRFINPMLVRQSLVGVMAPEKRGKTHWLTELGVQAARQGRNVAYFAVGDMTDTQMTRRLAMRLTGRNYMKSECGPVLVPVADCVFNQLGECDMPQCASSFACKERIEGGRYKLLSTVEELAGDGYVPCTYCADRAGNYKGAVWWKRDKVRILGYDEALEATTRFKKRHKGGWRLFCYAADQFNVQTMRRDLEQLERHGYVTDIAIADYADNFSAEDSRVSDIRLKQGETWRAMSALRQEKHLCLIAATQTDTASYDITNITMKNFTETKAKVAHVTAAIALNQTNNEKEEGVMRLGLVAAREMEFSISKQVHVLQCLKMGRPMLGSY